MNKPKLSPEAKAWILYDGGNSAFATTVIAAFFPIFFNDFWATGLEAVSYTHLTLPTICSV